MSYNQEKESSMRASKAVNSSVKSNTKKKVSKKTWFAEIFGTVAALIFFGVPFYFVIINSFKPAEEAALMNLSWPNSFNIIENYTEVITINDNRLLLAFLNSGLITLFTIVVLVIICSMAAFVLARRQGFSQKLNYLVLVGLMIPPAIVPTIWVLQNLGLYKTMPGIILLEAALRFSFACILYRAFVATIPRQLDEAAIIDGCGPLRLFFQIIFPLLKPVTATIIVLSSIQVYNDFENMLYFFPGAENATVQLTLYNFTGVFGTQYHYLFANVILISIPPLILFIFFNKKIVAGMTAGAVKG